MPANENGLVHVASARSVPETLKNLQTTIEARGLKIFALIDHSGEAEKAGLTHEAHSTPDLRQPQSWNSINGRRADVSHRFTAQSARLGRRGWESLGLLQQPGLPAAEARHPRRSGEKYRGSWCAGRESGRVIGRENGAQFIAGRHPEGSREKN